MTSSRPHATAPHGTGKRRRRALPRRRRKKSILYNGLFAVTLLALITLGIRMSVFMRGAVKRDHVYQMEQLSQALEIHTPRLGHSHVEPPLGIFRPDPRFEIIPAPDQHDRLGADLRPAWPDLSLIVTDAELARIGGRFRRKMLMWTGEGTLLLVLLGMSVIMLFRLVTLELRAAEESSRILDSITHELKTPLAGIRALLQSIALHRIPPEELGNVVAMGINETDRLEHMVENILLRNRLRSPEYALSIEPVNLRELVVGVLDHRNRVSGQPREPILESNAEVPALADTAAVRVILGNLLDNAAKYSSNTEPPRIVIGTEGDRAVLAVEDQGVGIAPEHLEDVFKPYFRVTEPNAPAQRGSGLGLSISRSLAERMGGSLTAHTQGRGQGTTFVLRLRKGAE